MLCPQKPAISLQEHPEFLARLQDEGFLEELRAQPTEALGKYHIELDSIPAVVKIPKIHANQADLDTGFLGLI